LDEIAALHLYTQESPLYHSLNAMLRDGDRDKIKIYFPFLRLMLSAMDKLPKVDKPVWRGVNSDISADYPNNAKIYWWGFSSTTLELSVLQNPSFLGNKIGTVFNIKANHGVSIQRYSAVKSEAEVLLPPGVRFVVRGVVKSGVTIIQLEESGLSGLN